MNGRPPRIRWATPAQRARALRVVMAQATDAADALALCRMIGLDPVDDRPTPRRGEAAAPAPGPLHPLPAGPGLLPSCRRALPPAELDG